MLIKELRATMHCTVPGQQTIYTGITIDFTLLIILTLSPGKNIPGYLYSPNKTLGVNNCLIIFILLTIIFTGEII